MNKFSARKNSVLGETGVVSPLIIGGVVVVGIVVLLIASGSLKFSGYIKTDSSKPQENSGSTQTTQLTTQPTSKPVEKPKSGINVKLGSEPFVDSKLGFSISYPEGWKVKSNTSGVNIYSPSQSKGGDQADALVSVVSGTLGELKDSKLATIADLHKVYIKKQFGSVEFTGEKEVKVNGVDGYELDFTGTMSSENMQAKYIIIKGTGSLFALIEIANAGMWKDFVDQLDASVQTFKLQ